MNKLFQFLTKDVFEAIGGILDNLVTTDEEKLKLRNELYSALLSKAEQTEDLKAEIIKAEAQGNWLQRSWRPILMLSFGFIVMYNKFFAPCFSLPNVPLEGDFWNLLQLGIGGYVVGRSAEKIINNLPEKTIK